MKSFLLISRLLLGLTFTLVGMNGFLHFLKLPPPDGLAGQFMAVLSVSHYLAPVYALEVTAGVLLLGNWFVPLALAILAPIIVNIGLYHGLLAKHGFGIVVVTVVFWAVVFSRKRAAFKGLFSARAD